MRQISMSFLPPEHWEDFQEMVLAVAQREWRDAHCSAFGRAGQEQAGIDVLVEQPLKAPIGVQAKKRRLYGAVGESDLTGNLSNGQIQKMIKEAEKFVPPLRELIIATTALTDAKLQNALVSLNIERSSKGVFSVHIWFWEKFQGCLNWDADLQRLYYRDWVEKTFGYSLEKHYLMMLRCALDRPAFTTRLEMEDSGDDMATAISDVEAAIRIGKLEDRRGDLIQRAPIGLDRVSLDARTHLEAALRSLHEARVSFRDAVKRGTLTDQRRGIFLDGAHGREDALLVDSLRAEALDRVNAALATAQLEELPNYLRPPNQL